MVCEQILNKKVTDYRSDQVCDQVCMQPFFEQKKVADQLAVMEFGHNQTDNEGIRKHAESSNQTCSPA